MKEFQDKNKVKLRMKCSVLCKYQLNKTLWKNIAGSEHETSNSKIIFILTYMIERVMNANTTKLKAPLSTKNKMQKWIQKV